MLQICSQYIQQGQHLKLCCSCPGEGKVQTEALSVLPADLRDVDGVESALLASGFDPQLPTYVLAECVLVYMEAEGSATVVRWLGKFLSTAACVVYEQVLSSNKHLLLTAQRKLAR